MAASHVVGFSALLLSHHPMLQSINFGARADQRVSILYDFLRAAAIPHAQIDPSRVGAGIPDLQQVPGFLPTSQQFYGGGIVAGAGLVGTLQAPFVPGAAGLWM
jgi:hypothetical protein